MEMAIPLLKGICLGVFMYGAVTFFIVPLVNIAPEKRQQFSIRAIGYMVLAIAIWEFGNALL